MVHALTVSLDCLNARGQGLRAEFQKCGDRFGHTIFGVRDGEAVPLLTSIEGTVDDVSPPSPLFTEQHQHDEILFLTGANTLGHWSISVQAIDGRLLFDVACRVSKEASRLGSTYRVLAEGVTVKPENAAVIELAGDILLIAPPLSAASLVPATVQWRYAVASKS